MRFLRVDFPTSAWPSLRAGSGGGLSGAPQQPEATGWHLLAVPTHARPPPTHTCLWQAWLRPSLRHPRTEHPVSAAPRFCNYRFMGSPGPTSFSTAQRKSRICVPVSRPFSNRVVCHGSLPDARVGCFMGGRGGGHGRDRAFENEDDSDSGARALPRVLGVTWARPPPPSRKSRCRTASAAFAGSGPDPPEDVGLHPN